MKAKIVADGEERRLQSPELQARLRALRETIEARYAEEMTRAGPIRKFILQWRMASEYRRERDKILPPDAMYACNHLTGSEKRSNK